MNHNPFFRSWQKTHLHILAVGDPAVRLYHPDGYLTRRWQAETGMQISIETPEWSDYPSKVFTALGSGSSEWDAVMLPGFFWLPKFASSGWLQTLGGILENLQQEWLAYDFTDIHPALSTECFFNGQHYLIPSFSEVQLVSYRLDWFRSAGLPELPLPVSLEIYVQAARRLHNPPTIFGTHLKGHPSESFPEWLPYLSACGGELFDSSEQPLFDSPAGHRSLEWMLALKQLSAPGVDQSDNTTILDLAWQNKVGIVNHWSGQMALLFEQAPLEAFAFSHLEHPWGTIWAFGIPTACKNPDAALAYLLYATSPENDQQQSVFSGSPVRRSTLVDPVAQKKYPWFPALLSAMVHKHSFPSFVRFADLVGNLYEMVNAVLAGKSPIAEALTDARRAIQIPDANPGTGEKSN